MHELDGDSAVYSFEDVMILNAVLDMKRDLQAYEDYKHERKQKGRQ